MLTAYNLSAGIRFEFAEIFKQLLRSSEGRSDATRGKEIVIRQERRSEGRCSVDRAYSTDRPGGMA